MNTKSVLTWLLTRLVLAPCVFIVLVFFISHLPRYRVAARQEVETQYRKATMGYREDMSTIREFQKLEESYGRVVTYRIEKESFDAWPTRYSFLVRVERERASTLERAAAFAGYGRATGRYAFMDFIETETVRPRSVMGSYGYGK